VAASPPLGFAVETPPWRVSLIMGVAQGVPFDPAWLPIVIFFARVADVSIGTLRMICIVRERRAVAVCLSFAEVTIWLLAVTSVLTHLDQWINILAYAGGYATGSAVGMWIEGRLALGTQLVTFVSSGTAQAVAERLRFADHTVTTLAGRSHNGPVSICHAIVPRKHAAAAIRMAREIDPDVIATVEDVRATSADRFNCCGPGKVSLPWRGTMLRRLLQIGDPNGARWVSGQRPRTGSDQDNTTVPQAA
jgi:uncharacterized protein YebE (UPF0316 family)